MTLEVEELFAAPVAPPPVLLDRSTIERYAVCPFQAVAVETKQVIVNNPAADSGIEAHRIIAEAVGAFARDGVPPRDTLENELPKARPDVQPDVLAAVRPSIYIIDKMLTSRNPADLMIYQGGQGEHSGQLAWDLIPGTPERPAVRPTTEIDLLMATASPEEVEEVDWKTGHTYWSCDDVKSSFQFRFHAWLLFKNLTGLQRVRVRVCMTRLRSFTSPVIFTMKDAMDFQGVLQEAYRFRCEAQATIAAGKTPATWPDLDKCCQCPCTHLCPAARDPALSINADPVAYAKAAKVAELDLDGRLAVLATYFSARGAIMDGQRILYGIQNKKETKPKPALEK